MKWYKIMSNELNRTQIKQSLINEHQKSALDKAQRISAFLVEKYNVEQVVLYGSVLNERFSMGSDIDLAVKGIPANYFFRAFSEVEELAYPFKVDIMDLEKNPEKWTYVEKKEVLYDRTT